MCETYCDRCEKPKDDLIDSGRGEKICPECIMAEADAHRDKQRLHRHRIEVKRERGMWVKK